MNIGNVAARKKVTARLFFARVGKPQVDLGNVLLYKHEPKIDRAQQLTMARGMARVTHEEPSKVDLRWSIKLDERSGFALQLLNLAKESATYQSQAFNGGTPAEDDVLDLRWRNVINFAWDPSADPDHVPVEGDDYSLDLVNGKVTILSSYFSDNNLEFACTFDVPGQASKTGKTKVLNPAEGVQFIDAYNVSGFAIHSQGEGADLVAGTDYDVDLATGKVTLFDDWDDTLTARWNQPAIAINNYILLSEAFVRGVATLYLTDQNGAAPGNAGAPKEIATFNAELTTTDWGENDGQKFNEFVLQLSATDGAVTVTARES